MKNELDAAETLLAFAISSKEYETQRPEILNFQTTVGMVTELKDIGTDLKFKPFMPSVFYTFDQKDMERLYSTSEDDLLFHPMDIIQDGIEVAKMHPNGAFVWTGYREAKNKVRGLAVIGKTESLIEQHTKIVYPSGKQDYMKRVIPISKTGKILIAKQHGAFMCSKYEKIGLALNLSTIEDCFRKGSVLTTIQDEKGVMFPIEMGDHLEVLKLRDSPLTEKGKRKALIHWVKKHLRTSKAGKVSNVKEHLRGIIECEIGGLKVKLSPNRDRYESLILKRI